MIACLLVSKKGTTSVFLLMILAGILLLVSLMIHAASQTAGRSYTDAVLDLAGRSILSEYDLQLQKRYGIFAFRTDESQTEVKIRFYAAYSFHDDAVKEALRGREYMDMLKLDLESVRVNLKGYSITDIDMFEQQILAYMKYGILKVNMEEPLPKTDSQKEIILRNDKVINSLPSKGYQGSLIADLKGVLQNGAPNLREIKTTAKNTYLIDEYIIGNFLNHQRRQDTRDTFFLHEVEYVLKGKYNDQSNYKAVKTDLFIMRNILNLLHINSDPEKRRQAETIAAALTLAKGKEIGALIVAEAWAAAEAENDLMLLEDGKEVALIKKKENWAVPVSDTLEYLWKDDCIKPKNLSGYDYEDYLRVLLFMENREQKLLRIMDLIQLNMKGSYYRDFDLREYYGGFQFEAVVKGRKYAYIEKY